MALLADPVTGAFFIGRFVSVLGAWVHNTAAAIFIFQLTGSASMVAAVSIAQFLPTLLLMPWSGNLADRGSRSGYIMLGGIVASCASATMAAWILLAPDPADVPAAVVIAAAVVVGVGFALEVPSLQAILPTLVSPSELSAAVTLNTAPVNIAQAAGPAIAAVGIATIGVQWAFVLATAGQLAFVAVIAVLRIDEGARASRRTKENTWEGLHWVRTHRDVLALIIGVTVVAVGADPAITLTPSLASELGGQSLLVGQLASAFGVGACFAVLAVGPLHRRIPTGPLITAGLVAMVIGHAGIVVSPWPLLSSGLMAVCGLGGTVCLITSTTQVFRLSPPRLRGRIMAVWSMGVLGIRPVAAGTTGFTADLLGVRFAFALVVVLIGLGIWSARPWRLTEAT